LFVKEAIALQISAKNKILLYQQRMQKGIMKARGEGQEAKGAMKNFCLLLLAFPDSLLLPFAFSL
jgi:hypothetical protein